MKVKVLSLPYVFQVLYVFCFTRPKYQVSVYRTIGPLVCFWNSPKMSRIMRKPAFCICKNKDADQLHEDLVGNPKDNWFSHNAAQIIAFILPIDILAAIFGSIRMHTIAQKPRCEL